MKLVIDLSNDRQNSVTVVKHDDLAAQIYNTTIFVAKDLYSTANLTTLICLTKMVTWSDLSPL